MATPIRIPVRLTIAQLNALVASAEGDLESCSEFDWESDVITDLESAVVELRNARRRAFGKETV